MKINGLIETWLTTAPLFRKHGQEGIAVAYEKCAEDLQEALSAHQHEVLTIKQAAEEAGYSEGHLRRLVRDGKIPNAGRFNSPKISRKDLPAPKPGVDPIRLTGQFDEERIVRSIVDAGGQ